MTRSIRSVDVSFGPASSTICSTAAARRKERRSDRPHLPSGRLQQTHGPASYRVELQRLPWPRRALCLVVLLRSNERNKISGRFACRALIYRIGRCRRSASDPGGSRRAHRPRKSSARQYADAPSEDRFALAQRGRFVMPGFCLMVTPLGRTRSVALPLPTVLTSAPCLLGARGLLFDSNLIPRARHFR